MIIIWWSSFLTSLAPPWFTLLRWATLVPLDDDGIWFSWPILSLASARLLTRGLIRTVVYKGTHRDHSDDKGCLGWRRRVQNIFSSYDLKLSGPSLSFKHIYQVWFTILTAPPLPQISFAYYSIPKLGSSSFPGSWLGKRRASDADPSMLDKETICIILPCQDSGSGGCRS